MAEQKSLEQNQDKDDKVQLGDRIIGVIEPEPIDLAPFIGKKGVIESITEHKSKRGYGFYIRVETQIISETKDGIQLRANRIFGLKEQSDGKVGWIKDGKLDLFLKKMNVEHYNNLVGKEVILQTTTNQKDGKDYLTFN